MLTKAEPRTKVVAIFIYYTYRYVIYILTKAEPRTKMVAIFIHYI